MKPCVSCGKALENRAKTCEFCDAEQLATESTAVVRDDLTTTIEERGPLTPSEILWTWVGLIGYVVVIALGGYLGDRAGGTFGIVVGVVAAMFVFELLLWSSSPGDLSKMVVGLVVKISVVAVGGFAGDRLIGGGFGIVLGIIIAVVVSSGVVQKRGSR